MAASNSSKVLHMAAVVELLNAPSPCDNRFHGGVEKLQEVMVKLGVVDLGNGMVMAVHEQGGVAAAMAASSSDSASTQREKRGEME
jgi:hypothetical protein